MTEREIRLADIIVALTRLAGGKITIPTDELVRQPTEVVYIYNKDQNTVMEYKDVAVIEA